MIFLISIGAALVGIGLGVFILSVFDKQFQRFINWELNKEYELKHWWSSRSSK